MNTYNLKARTYPVILSLLPVLAIGILFSMQFQNYYQSLASLGISTVLFFLFSQLGRDRGKRLEKTLWNEWGGSPTTQLFRFSDKTIDSITKKRYHETMNKHVESDTTPTEDLEAESLEICDEVYKSWTKYLIGKTRDITKFSLLYSENVNYGFRRNSLGLKPFSITVSIILCVVIWVGNYLTNNGFQFNDSNTLIAQSILLIPILFWLFIVKKDWVKIPAYAYAERLLESIDEVKNENAPQQNV